MGPTDPVAVLLRKAADDEYVLGVLVNDPNAADAIVGFHAQQAVEKHLKAVLASRGIPYPLTHDLMTLIERLSSKGIEFPFDIGEVIRLTPFAAKARYDDPLPTTGDFDRQRVLNLVQRLREWALSMI